MKKKYIIRLSAEERQRLTDLVRKGKAAAYRRTRARKYCRALAGIRL